MKKEFILALLIVIIFGGGLFFYNQNRSFICRNAEARSGCCSYHGGVCGCGCCDGTPLSSTCAPYYPQCSNPTPTYTAPVYVPKIEYKTDTQKEIMAFTTKYEDDSTLEIDQTKVKQKGVNGEKTLTYKVTYTDGKETAREKTGDSITTSPIDGIILKGTKPKAQPTSNSNQNTTVAGTTESTIGGILILASIVSGGFWLIRVIKRNRKSD